MSHIDAMGDNRQGHVTVTVPCCVCNKHVPLRQVEAQRLLLFKGQPDGKTVCPDCLKKPLAQILVEFYERQLAVLKIDPRAPAPEPSAPPECCACGAIGGPELPIQRGHLSLGTESMLDHHLCSTCRRDKSIFEVIEMYNKRQEEKAFAIKNAPLSKCVNCGSNNIALTVWPLTDIAAQRPDTIGKPLCEACADKPAAQLIAELNAKDARGAGMPPRPKCCCCGSDQHLCIITAGFGLAKERVRAIDLHLCLACSAKNSVLQTRLFDARQSLPECCGCGEPAWPTPVVEGSAKLFKRPQMTGKHLCSSCWSSPPEQLQLRYDTRNPEPAAGERPPRECISCGSTVIYCFEKSSHSDIARPLCRTCADKPRWQLLAELNAKGVRVPPSQAISTPVDAPAPIPIRLNCPECGALHIDEGIWKTKPHHTHTCQNITCGLTWRPAVVHTVGVRFLPGFQNDPLT